MDEKGGGLLKGVNEMTWLGNNSTCNLYNFMSPDVKYEICSSNDYSGIRASIIPKPVDCDRLHKAVGKENVRTFYGPSSEYARAGGNW